MKYIGIAIISALVLQGCSTVTHTDSDENLFATKRAKFLQLEDATIIREKRAFDRVLSVDIQPSFAHDEAILIGEADGRYTIHSHVAASNLHVACYDEHLAYDLNRIQNTPVTSIVTTATNGIIVEACAMLFEHVNLLPPFPRPSEMGRLDGQTAIITYVDDTGKSTIHEIWVHELEYETLLIKCAKLLNAYALLDDDYADREGSLSGTPEQTVFIHLMANEVQPEDHSLLWESPREFILQLLRSYLEKIKVAQDSIENNRRDVLQRYENVRADMEKDTDIFMGETPARKANKPSQSTLVPRATGR